MRENPPSRGHGRPPAGRDGSAHLPPPTHPGDIISTTPVTGLAANESLIGLDYRPADGLLYAVAKNAASAGALYTIDAHTGILAAK